MPDIRPDRMDETEPTPDELAALIAGGFDEQLLKTSYDFGCFDLVTALRIGYALGRQDSGEQWNSATTRRGDRA